MHARMPKNFVLDQRIERAADAIETSAQAYRGRWAEACFPLIPGGRERFDARMPKNFVLDQRIERAADAIETSAQAYRGRWAEACFPLIPGGRERFERVHLDLGCGKGAYIAAMAERHPDTLFIGMDSEPVCVVHAAQLVLDRGLKNALVIPGDAAKLDRIFAPGELSSISINFPTPHPKRRNARLRVTTAAHLYEFSLPQFQAIGWHITCATHDDRTTHPDQPITEYEQRLTEQGATVHAVYAHPAPEAATEEQLQAALDLPQSLIDYLPEQLQAALDLPQSLIDYLPDDLFAGDYIPYGMSYAIDNLRNRRRHLGQRRGE